MGIVAVISFWRSLSFQTAIAIHAILFYAGVSVGHVVQAVTAGNFASDNFGMLLMITVLHVILLTVFLIDAWRREPN